MTYRITVSQMEIMDASTKWPRTGKNGGGQKVTCPVCGATGYARGRWTWNHLTHVKAPCGKYTTRLASHVGSCSVCSVVATP